MAVSKPVILAVLDGFGVSLQVRGNAIHAAKKPNLDLIERSYPFTTLQASGASVGLPWGEAGNSEVGHLTMGAGRVIYHHLPRIIVAIKDGSFFSNPALAHAIEHVRANGSSLHLLGLVSSGSVHSYLEHLSALLELVGRSKLERVWLHIITDGKDAPAHEAKTFVGKLDERIREKNPNVSIASLVGRFYAMDRDEQWERVRRAYELLTEGKGSPFTDPADYLTRSYAAGESDEFIEPGYREEGGKPLGRITEGDGLIIFNFREDSVREITAAFAREAFDAFPKKRIANLKVVTMTEYEKNLPGVEAAFPPLEISSPLGRVLAFAGKTQLHIAESEKYAHVTYFFNGGDEKPFPDEDRILVPSSAVPHFDDQPEMKAPEITAKIIERIGEYDFILVNYANADMVGHTGNFDAAVKAVEALDQAIGELMAAVTKQGGVLIVTGDHGNAEQKIHPQSGEPITEHTANPVPFYLIGERFKLPAERSPWDIAVQKKEIGGILTDVAPTILELMELPQPPEMTGKSLLPALLREN
ncbi:MAG: 2,3-bisphosphoglycerate-independent phosphoglycerate mutase [bacterium]|nr:2,3-bisphosphoglycerate-independent phosphoglycerate mutase [bacterium]